DRFNCGSCGHDCLGGTCVAAKCQPFAWATGMISPMGLAVVGSDVYAVDFGTAAADPTHVDGSLIRIAPNGTQTLLQSGLRAPASLWYDEATDSFLMADYYRSLLSARPRGAASGSVTTMISTHLGFPSGIATNANSLIVSNSGTVQPEA